jgi:PAS domain S-box-containing protein
MNIQSEVTMPVPLAVLIVEDMESDAQLIVRLLKKAGYELVFEQVETAEQMRAALESRSWDIVISDYKLPQFDGRAALQLLQDTRRDLPFIVVSGTIGEETAVSMMKAGAHDYLIKGNLARLAPAVKRELEQAEMRRGRRQAEEALRESEERYHSLFDRTLDGVYRSTHDGKFISVNPAMVKMFGYSSSEEMLKIDIKTDLYFSPEDRASLVLDTGLGDVDGYRLRRKDGSEIWVEDHGVYIYDDQGNILYHDGIMRDVTKRKQAEEALSTSESKLRALVEQAPMIVYTESADTRETIYISPQVEKVTGYTSDEWIQDRNLWKSITHPEDLPALLVEDERTTASHEPFNIEYRIFTRDGRTLWLRDEAVIIKNADGTPLFWHGVMYDITERKQAEEALRESQLLYHSLVESSPLSICRKDLAGRFTFANKRFLELSNITLADLVGKTDFDLHPSELAEKYRRDDQSILDSGQVRVLIEERAIRGGESILIQSIKTPIYDGSGKINGIQISFWDITDRMRAEERLRESEERYRELFNSMIDGFALHEIICDANGIPVDYRFLEVNPAFERLTGLRSENVIGKTALEVMPNLEPYWIEVYGNVALTGRSTFYENHSKELARYFEVSVYCPRPKQFATVMVDITERKQAEEGVQQRVTQLEMLYQSGLALSQLLNPKEIGQKILELLQEKLNWHHTRIRLYHPQDDSLELLDFNQPGLKDEMERREVVERFQTLITHSGQGMSGWVIQHGQPVRSGDVCNDPRYVKAYSGIHSGLYVPMKLGEHVVGVISIEDEAPDAFSEADERLIVTLANQAASAFENARLFEETRQRVMELETLNRISLVLRAVSKQNEMLSIVLDEALAILNTSHGSIELYNKATDALDQTILRGWLAQVTAPHPSKEGIAGKVFTSGEIYIAREFVTDPATRPVALGQIPAGWGGVCLPIRTTQQTLGVMMVSMPSKHDLNKNEIRLLSILSEMTGAALQRMQLHEQTVRRLEQLKALRAVDQAISSSRDMQLTLNILLTHTLSQLGVEAADVLLLQPGSNQLELVAGNGFHTLPFESFGLNDSIAGRAIMEHRPIMRLDLESTALRETPPFLRFWKKEGFVCYWCVPLIIKGEVKGVLEIYCRKTLTPDAEWLEFLEALAGQAAIAIENTQLFEYLQRANMDLNLAYDATIEGWSHAMDLRDHETEGHTLRVTDLTVKLARAMRVSESQLIAIRRGALLHDIGKIGVPDAVLLKEGDLTDEEWAIMRKHPEFARDMLMPITYLNDALNIPYCHHERWDGTGYPQGLKGDHIPLVARIFAVVDVWDALTNDRAYRKKWTKQKARQHIKEQSGKHFDPQVVDVFLKQVEKD